MTYVDDLARRWVLDYLGDAGGFVLGRRTAAASASSVMMVHSAR